MAYQNDIPRWNMRRKFIWKILETGVFFGSSKETDIIDKCNLVQVNGKQYLERRAAWTSVVAALHP